MMEFARNVRELIVGMKDTATPEEENFMNIAQDLHDRYLKIMDDFTKQASDQALSMRPEARIMSHQLRLRIYQDWRAKLMERIFSGSPISSSPPTKSPPPTEPIEHSAECEEATCICELEARLDAYKQVVESYLEGSTKGKRSPSSSCDSPDATDPGSDDGDEFVFEFPEFLGMAPLRERLQS